MTPRVAAQETPNGEHGSTQEAELTVGLERIGRARRVVFAAWVAEDRRAGERREQPPISANEEDRNGAHAVARSFWKTSATRSSSHSNPRLSIASPSPGRAIKT